MKEKGQKLGKNTGENLVNFSFGKLASGNCVV
jgi:hypothetical protein